MQFEIVLRAHLDLHPETVIGFVDSVERSVITVIPFEMTMRVGEHLAGHGCVGSDQNGCVSRRPGQYWSVFHALYRKNRPNHRFLPSSRIRCEKRAKRCRLVPYLFALGFVQTKCIRNVTRAINLVPRDYIGSEKIKETHTSEDHLEQINKNIKNCDFSSP